MPFKALEQSLNKESEHIKELFHKEKHGEISIDNQAKNELLEIEKILQEQIEKSRRYLSNTPVEDDLTLLTHAGHIIPFISSVTTLSALAKDAKSAKIRVIFFIFFLLNVIMIFFHINSEWMLKLYKKGVKCMKLSG